MTFTLKPGVLGLTQDHIQLLSSQGISQSIDYIDNNSDGSVYQIAVSLEEGELYTLVLEKEGFLFSKVDVLYESRFRVVSIE